MSRWAKVQRLVYMQKADWETEALGLEMTSDTSLPGEHQLQPRGRQHPSPALSHDGILKEKDCKN